MMENNEISEDLEKFADNFFDKGISDRERAIFELGIKLGALFHIAMGIPISKDKTVIKAIEEGLKQSIECQPYVKKVKINILEEHIQGSKKHEFDYSIISPKNLKVEIELEYKNIKVSGIIKWIDKLNYPLMFINYIQ
ncbi:MAG: dihydroneopterin aldolase family protein [Promethearchaeota archaeon]